MTKLIRPALIHSRSRVFDSELWNGYRARRRAASFRNRALASGKIEGNVVSACSFMRAAWRGVSPLRVVVSRSPLHAQGPKYCPSCGDSPQFQLSPVTGSNTSYLPACVPAPPPI